MLIGYTPGLASLGISKIMLNVAGDCGAINGIADEVLVIALKGE